MKNVFKFRAECMSDVTVFLKKLYTSYGISIEKPHPFPDVVVELTTFESLDEIKNIFKIIPDSHVMLETIMPIEQYTGNREFSV